MLEAERQAAFAAALINPALAPPGGLTAPEDSVTTERFAVYRNNATVALIEALRSSFPVVNRLVGDEFFSAMAAEHARQTLPSSPVLLDYGGEFPAFVEHFEPAATLPYLADVARLEWAWLEAYHAADAASLGSAALAQVARSERPKLSLVLHPSVRWVAFDYPALSIWRRHQLCETPDFSDLDHAPERVLLMRPTADVEAYDLPDGGGLFLDALESGVSRAHALAAAVTATPGLDLPGLLRDLVWAGAFTGFAREAETAANDFGGIA